MNQMPLSLNLAVLAFMMTVIWGGPLLRILRHFKVGKVIRVEEPGHHAIKMGTPTMGGVMFIAPVVLLTLLLNASSLFGVTGIGRSILLPLVVMVAFGILGAVDDWQGIRGPRRGEGMRSRTKFIIQVALAFGAAYALKYLLQAPDLYLPAYPIEIRLG
ncbi:MAG: phospho-N-acetylmuramoyl-pentapeptide-transferase, partial [Anaerolineae bacterium CG03_land_8_20_14_0_80_58_20]